jgi:hypothetical protein
MSRQFAEMMEMHRKQQVMATLKRSVADIIGATQADEDFERDSLALQSLAPLHVFVFR